MPTVYSNMAAQRESLDNSSLAPVQKVFAVPELTEAILEYIDIRSVLRLIRTNKYFRELIETSLPLRRKLFLTQEADAKARPPIDADDCGPKVQIYEAGNGMQVNPMFSVGIRGSWRIQAHDLKNAIKACPMRLHRLESVGRFPCLHSKASAAAFTYAVHLAKDGRHDGYGTSKIDIKSKKHARKLLDDIEPSYSRM